MNVSRQRSNSELTTARLTYSVAVLAERDGYARAALGDALSRRGFLVCEVGDLAALRIALVRDLPRLVLLDWGLAGVESPELLVEILLHATRARVVLTADDPAAARFARAHALELFLKPFDATELAYALAARHA